VLLLCVENLRESAALKRRDIDLSNAVGPCRVAHDIDQAINGMQAAEQIVVLAIGAREERCEMGKTDALEAADTPRSL